MVTGNICHRRDICCCLSAVGRFNIFLRLEILTKQNKVILSYVYDDAYTVTFQHVRPHNNENYYAVFLSFSDEKTAVITCRFYSQQ